MFAATKAGKGTSLRSQGYTKVASVGIKAALTRESFVCLSRSAVIVHNLPQPFKTWS